MLLNVSTPKFSNINNFSSRRQNKINNMNSHANVRRHTGEQNYDAPDLQNEYLKGGDNFELNNVSRLNYERPKHGRHLLTGLAVLASIGAVSASYLKTKSLINAKNTDAIVRIKAASQKIIDENPLRNSEAVKLYKQTVAKRKADVLEYKLQNNMLGRKSMHVKQKINNNLSALRGLNA